MKINIKIQLELKQISKNTEQNTRGQKQVNKSLQQSTEKSTERENRRKYQGSNRRFPSEQGHTLYTEGALDALKSLFRVTQGVRHWSHRDI